MNWIVEGGLAGGSVTVLGWLRNLLPEELLDLQSTIAAVLVIAVGVVVGIIVGQALKRLFLLAGVPAHVEGTAFERTAQSLGTSTTSILARLPSWVIYGVSVLIAISIVEPTDTNLWEPVVGFVYELFIAIVVVIVGVVVADKAEVVASERLRSVKLPEVTIVPLALKYSILYVALLIALGHLGVNTEALLIMLAGYLVAIVFLTGIATRDLLASGTAGIYLLLNQPYGIGDRISVGDREGIVQEVDVFVTRLEDDDAEYIVPNRKIFEHGVARHRER